MSITMNHHFSAAAGRVSQALTSSNASGKAASTSTSTSGVSSAQPSTGVSSNDFLTLLVTEMKNQDPTQPTDPGAYIQQLVGVNSLQQLIAIHQDLTPTTSGTSGASPSSMPSA